MNLSNKNNWPSQRVLVDFADLSQFITERDKLAQSAKSYLIGLGMPSCNACKAVKLILMKALCEYDFSACVNPRNESFAIWFDISDPSQIATIGYNIIDLPTVLAFSGTRLIGGWTGLTVDSNNQVPKGLGLEILNSFFEMS